MSGDTPGSPVPPRDLAFRREDRNLPGTACADPASGGAGSEPTQGPPGRGGQPQSDLPAADSGRQGRPDLGDRSSANHHRQARCDRWHSHVAIDLARREPVPAPRPTRARGQIARTHSTPRCQQSRHLESEGRPRLESDRIPATGALKCPGVVSPGGGLSVMTGDVVPGATGWGDPPMR